MLTSETGPQRKTTGAAATMVKTMTSTVLCQSTRGYAVITRLARKSASRKATSDAGT